MHEELYLKSRDPLRWMLLAAAIALLPFAFFDLALIDGAPVFAFRFDLPTLAAAGGFAAVFFLPFEKKLEWLLLPYGAMLILQFLRFGTVSLFGRDLAFKDEMPSYFYMAVSFFTIFFLFFIGGGKLRSRLPLLIVFAVFTVLLAASLTVSFPPFFVYEHITEGRAIRSVSRACAAAIFTLTVLFTALCLCDDKVREEKAQKRAQNNQNGAK